MAVDAGRVRLGQDRLERWKQLAVLWFLLAGCEDRGDIQQCGGAGEPEHVGLDLLARRCFDHPLEHARLVVDE
jgi:hypothetical protein